MSLISVAELAAALDDPDLRIADVRWSLAAPGGGRAAYATAHLRAPSSSISSPC